MAYGTIKVDTVTFTDGGIDKSVSISGLVQNPTFSGNVTVTGTVSGNTIQGQTISGVTVTGTTASFTSGVFANISGGTHTITSGVFAAGSAASPSISFTSDPDTGLYSPGANQVALSTNGTGRLFVDATGRVGIGTSSPSSPLTVESSAGNQVKITYPSVVSYFLNATSSGDFAINKDGTERARIDSSGRLLVGTSSSASAGDSQYSKLQIRGNTSGSPQLGIISIQREEAASTITTGEGIGEIVFTDNAGNTFAAVVCEADANAGAGDYPGRLVFSTTADGASAPTERMRIDSAGVLKVSNNNTYAAGGYHQFNQNASSQWTLGVLGRNATDPYGIRVEYTNAAPNGTVSQFLYCVDTAGVKAEIRSNGGLANYQANNVNLSDRNAKKDISLAANTWDCIKKWEIVNYRYKDQPDNADLNLGVIAQQVAESCPEVITVFQKAKDDQPEKLGVKEQQMYWMAIKALQEAQVRIEALEAKVAALESA